MSPLVRYDKWQFGHVFDYLACPIGQLVKRICASVVLLVLYVLR